MFKCFIMIILIVLIKSDYNSTNSSKSKPDLILNFMESSIKEIKWCGKPTKEILLALTEMGSLYRSTDKGFTWKKINDLIYKVGEDSKDKKDVFILFYLFSIFL